MSSLNDWLWLDKSGKKVITQKPNTLIKLAFMAYILQILFEHELFDWTSAILFLLFGLDELTRGVNGFRRLLGVAVTAGAVSSISILVNGG